MKVLGDAFCLHASNNIFQDQCYMNIRILCYPLSRTFEKGKLFETSPQRTSFFSNFSRMDDFSDIQVAEKVRDVVKWPTDTAEIDYVDPHDNSKLEYPHTVIVFFPGNPGLAGWCVRV